MNDQEQLFFVTCAAWAAGSFLGNFLSGLLDAEQLGHRLAKWLRLRGK